MTELTREELHDILAVDDNADLSRWHSIRLSRLKTLCTMALKWLDVQPRPKADADYAPEAINMHDRMFDALENIVIFWSMGWDDGLDEKMKTAFDLVKEIREPRK